MSKAVGESKTLSRVKVDNETTTYTKEEKEGEETPKYTEREARLSVRVSVPVDLGPSRPDFGRWAHITIEGGTTLYGEGFSPGELDDELVNIVRDKLRKAWVEAKKDVLALSNKTV